MIGVILLIIVFGFVGTSTSANDTNATNTSQDDYVTMDSSAVTPMDDPTPGTTGTRPKVSISVTSAVNLGNNVIADGSEHFYPSATQVNVSASERTGWFVSNNDKLNLYVKASGDLVSASDSIPLTNLKYNGFNSTLAPTSFFRDYTKVKSWDFTYAWGDIGLFIVDWSSSANVQGNYYLTVPTGVSHGTYKTTVYYLAIIELQ